MNWKLPAAAVALCSSVLRKKRVRERERTELKGFDKEVVMSREREKDRNSPSCQMTNRLPVPFVSFDF
jgi:hypothetical protein